MLGLLATVESFMGSVFFGLLLGVVGVGVGVGLTLYAQRRGWLRGP